LGKVDLLPLKYRRRLFGSPPVSARHVEWSAIASTDDEQPPPSDELVGLALAAAQAARCLRLDRIADRCASPLEASWVNHWPGDHYRFLAALGTVMDAGQIVEVGTFTGMGTLALAACRADVRTYDVVPWDAFANTLFRSDDFDGHIDQRVGDLADAAFFAEEAGSLRAASVIFIDGPKDGTFEPAFLSRLLPTLRRGQVLVFDDIRTLPMLRFWRELPLAKLDVTSFGHWSGTGLAVA
jgi:predicted O-methyltransferase YrrM